ncbi:unnamed protein product [Lota lota]
MAKGRTRDCFAWNDEEVELLLKVTHEYKSLKAALKTDWESSQSKYSDILELYRERDPSPEEATATGKGWKKDQVTKGQLTTKLKAIRNQYRQAVESGSKSGHGRVILHFFGLCKSIWGESAATAKAISEGIETSDLTTAEPIPGPPDTGSGAETRGDGAAEDAGSPETAGGRRRGLYAARSRGRREKLKRKPPTDSADQEDLDLRRRLLRRLEATDEEFGKTMERWSSALDRLNSNFELLVQHVVGSGAPAPHNTYSHGLPPPRGPPQEPSGPGGAAQPSGDGSGARGAPVLNQVWGPHPSAWGPPGPASPSDPALQQNPGLIQPKTELEELELKVEEMEVETPIGPPGDVPVQQQ